jgi:hypothetical protein
MLLKIVRRDLCAINKFEHTYVLQFFFFASIPFSSDLDQTMNGKVQNTLKNKCAIIIT